MSDYEKGLSENDYFLINNFKIDNLRFSYLRYFLCTSLKVNKMYYKLKCSFTVVL